ncbi:TetR/AcrR family transcriptional regulator [Cupriavidus consociatus]|uniref:TetR/AcrR family transcriptional regulator n=1 Tax=Cupriavidus consociatus TaxID=2821357 RepID=UPI001AE6BA59|nr:MULTISPECIES: TetR/AcrR family transcriptional regulator [unclassified Cupriavidus]MBP0620934.1 TetR/AcrR family transcriptional regulator [Cupriavidus sp. LEh25]MDK2657600.1 helix-turn-helix domain-containing protein [Cupriavidus sp. LEh21]
MSATAETHDRQRLDRKAAVSEAKRAHILAAARQVFEERGLEGANIREIAKQAGYTPGAIYSYFQAKEEIYGALLAESLERLNEAVAQSVTAPRSARERAVRAALGFYEFYANNPRDLDLGFYLFGGMRPHGLTPDLNATLNARLRDALTPFGRGLQELGASEAEAKTEVTAFFGHCVGLLILENTKRIKMFQEDSGRLCKRYIDQVIQRICSAT